MGVKTFTDAIGALLIGDAAFTTAVQQALGLQAPIARLIRGNVPWDQISAAMLPCFLIEQGDGKTSDWGTGESSGMVIGQSQQDYASDLDVCVLWYQQDRELAADQRALLPDLFAQLLLRNPMPGSVNAAWLSEWMPDQGVRHPLQCWVGRIHADYTIERDA